MSSSKHDKKHIYDLLNQIQQQRLDLRDICYEWLDSTSQYDKVWYNFFSMRHYLAICSSIIAVWFIRSPNRIIRWTKRGIGLWQTWRMLKLLSL